jgi:poly(A) polymerase
MRTHVHIQDRMLIKIGAIADELGVRAFVVGGYLRDLALARAVKDIDIVVIGDGIAFAREVAARLKKRRIVVFERFGTAMLHLDDATVEFVGARKESYDRSSRKPAVSAGTLEDDLARRDFTINAMAASLNGQDQGALVDPHGGRGDLEARLIRTPLDPRATFSDDPLRILRAMRFSAQLGFTVDADVLRAAEEMRDRLSIVSQERITDELLKILASPKPSVGFGLLLQTGVLESIFPEIAHMGGVEQREEYHHKDVFWHTLKVVDNVAAVSDDVWLRLAALLHDVGKPKTKAFREGTGWTFHGHEEVGARMVKRIFGRMKLPMTHLRSIEKLVRLHLRPMALVDEGVTDSALRRLLFDAGEEIDDLMTLCRADITSKNPKKVAAVRNNYDRVVEKLKDVEEKDRLRNWQPPVDGLEIMRLFELEPGPAVGKLKTAIREAILEGEIPNEREAAVDFLLRNRDKILSK